MRPRSTLAPGFSAEETAAAYAEDTADLVAAFLKNAGVASSNKRPIHLPAALLLSLGGLLRIEQWQRAGIGPVLGEGLPNATECLQRIREDILQRGAEQVVPIPQSFWFTWVFHAWHRCFCHAAPSHIECDLLIAAEPNAESLSWLAKWLWQYRHSQRGTVYA